MINYLKYTHARPCVIPDKLIVLDFGETDLFYDFTGLSLILQLIPSFHLF